MSISDKLLQIAENQEKVFKAGKQSEYDIFWDNFQDYGNRTSYIYAFAGYGWGIDNFKPKYNITPTNAEYMFASTSRPLSKGGLYKADITSILEEYNVKLDTSQCTRFSNFLRYESPARLPEIDTRAADNLNSMFLNSSVHIVDKIILREDGSQIITTIFAYSHPGLKDVLFEGVIGCNFNMSIAPSLAHDSIVSIINALSTTTSDLTVSFSKGAVNNAFETEEGLADGANSEEWLALIATKPNWTISLI